jgi:sugar lactone lactonase YvrE
LREGTLGEVADLSAYAPADCNDMYVDATGRAYIGNFGSDLATDPVRATPLVRVDPDGTVTVSADHLVFPNGTVGTPQGTLLIAETFAYRVSEFDVGADGRLKNRRVWASFRDAPAHDMDEILATDDLAPDGICLDAEGALWVADATGAGAHRVLAGGEIVESIELDGLTAFALALGGEDGHTLYLCAGPPLGRVDPKSGRYGSVLSTRVRVPAATQPR